MKVTATELMKQLKYIEEEINDIHRNDEEKSTVLVEKATDTNGKTILVPVYAEEYDFAINRSRIKELHKEERLEMPSVHLIARHLLMGLILQSMRVL